MAGLPSKTHHVSEIKQVKPVSTLLASEAYKTGNNKFSNFQKLYYSSDELFGPFESKTWQQDLRASFLIIKMYIKISKCHLLNVDVTQVFEKLF